MATPIRWYKFSEDTADLGKDSSSSYQVEIGGQKTDIKAVADGLASDTKYTVNLY